MNLRLKEIPAEYYPFIAGPHNSRIDALSGEKDIQIKVPQYYSWPHEAQPILPPANTLPSFTPHPNHHIQISGDRVQVQQARAEIERQVEALRRQIALEKLDIPRGQHQFIVGNNGESLHDLLHETGCAVILPPDNDDSESLYVTGPREKLDAGLEKVMKLASDFRSSSINISQLHNSAPLGAHAHARAITRYLQQRQAIAAIEKAHDSKIVLPAATDGPVTWEVYSRDGANTLKARSDISKLISAHPPTRVRQFGLDPFYHNHVRQNHQQRVREEHGVYLLFPDPSEQTDQVIIIYGGQEPELPRNVPSKAEIAQFEQALRKAQEEILDLISGQQPIKTRSVDVPPK